MHRSLPLLFFLATLFAIVAIPFGTTASSAPVRDRAELERAAAAARDSGLDSVFIAKVMAGDDADFIEKTVRINVTNYAYKPDYSGHYNAKSVKEVKAFMKENDSLMKAVQKASGVTKEVVASILWIESRCGKITGTYHVPSVYMSLLLASDSVYVEQSLAKVTADTTLDSAATDSVRNLIVTRAQKKARWAVKELKALQSIDERGVMHVESLKGSWAGAFGYPQFLPSSYNSWAVDGDSDGTIDLYNLADAAFSIGNYLKVNGWGKKKKDQRKAVHHYNNSDAYVDAVFTLASKIR